MYKTFVRDQSGDKLGFFKAGVVRAIENDPYELWSSSMVSVMTVGREYLRERGKHVRSHEPLVNIFNGKVKLNRKLHEKSILYIIVVYSKFV